MEIISLTPLPLQSDSRALKFTESFARAGYDSLLLGGPGLRQRLASGGQQPNSVGDKTPPGTISGSARTLRSQLKRLIDYLRYQAPPLISIPLLLIPFLCLFGFRYVGLLI